MAIEPQPLTKQEPPISENRFPTNALYVNSFKAGLSHSDIFIVLGRNGTNFATLNMSYTLAKTLSQALNQLIERLEKTSGQQIMTQNLVKEA